MLEGTLCPQCNKPVMPYRRFFREAEPCKISKCSHCQVELKRSPAVWLLLCLGCAAAAVATRFALNYIQPGGGIFAIVGLAIILMLVFTLGINFCGWLFVGWRIASEPTGTATKPPSPAP